MIRVALSWVLNGLALYLVSRILPGFYLHDFASALWAAAILGLVNILVRPLLLLLTLPLNILTLGLFTFVINAAMLKLTAHFLRPGFEIASWGTAILAAVLLTVASVVLHYIFRPVTDQD